MSKEEFKHELHTDSYDGGAYTNRGSFKSKDDAHAYAKHLGYKEHQYSIKEHQKPEWKEK